jgi:hypothetical protein
MTKEEAWKIIDACKNWNTGQKSVSLIFDKRRTAEDDVLDAKRASLKKAWEVIGEL